jgi:3',5'-cyclic-AMP phosphodiesterase
MPITLPPFSRRSFLKGSLAAGAAAWCSRDLFAAVRRTDPHTWALLSDTHIAADPTVLGRGINMADHLQQACREVLGVEPAPAGMIVHGDCAFSNGQRGDYEHFLRLLRPIRERGLPIHLALGNHDHRQRFHAGVKPDTPAAVVDKYVSHVPAERMNFFILDSLNEIPSNPGLLGAQQLQWLARMIDAHPGKPAIIVVHHNMGRMVDAGELTALMDRRAHVKAMFHGHIHQWRLNKSSGGVHLVNLLPVAYPRETGGASGWVQASFAPDGVRLEVRCINSADPLHRSVHDLKWR